MNWMLEYYDGSLPLKEVSDIAWDEVDVHTVQRVYVYSGTYTMIMSGHDYYWIDEENGEFGCFIAPHNYGIYEGNTAVSYAASDKGFVHTGSKVPDQGINVLGSTYMPENEGIEVGIL